MSGPLVAVPNAFRQSPVRSARPSDGHPTLRRKRSGYGTNLIRDLVPHEIGGAVDLVFATEGVSCKITLPPRAADKPIESGIWAQLHHHTISKAFVRLSLRTPGTSGRPCRSS